MRFYTKQHQFYCGIDVHARLLAICIVDQAGAVVCRTQIPADKQLLLQTLAPYRADRFERQAGGTVEFLGRDQFCPLAPRADGARLQSACPGKGPLADPQYVFGAAGRRQ